MTKIETGLGARLDRAVERLDGFYKKRTLRWLVSLYDSERGGFYYSESAKRHEGFLPDVESTLQAVNLLFGGAVRGVKGEIPDDMREKISDFVLSLRGDDGFFYHEQWGKEISDSRRSCDKACATSLMDKLGTSDESEKKAESTPVSSSKKSESGKKSTNEHFTDADALERYLDSLIISDAQTVAEKIKGEYKDIKEASLTSELFDYLDSLSERFDSKYWNETSEGALAMWIYRIGSLYNDEGRRIVDAYGLVKRCTSLILKKDKTECIMQIHSTWSALATVLKNVATAYDNNARERYACFSYVRALAPEMIKITISKLRSFKKLSGGYSYYIDYSPAYAHGTHVSLGVNEGDMNATAIAVYGIRSSIFSSVGLSVAPIWESEELSELISRSSHTVKKRRVPDRFRDDPAVKIK